MKYKITKWFDKYHVWRKGWFGYTRIKHDFDSIGQAEIFCMKQTSKNMEMSIVVKELELL